MNKTKAVLEWLESGNEITSWDAIYMFRATRLSGIIYNLKQQGYNIQSKLEKSVDGTQFSKYWLVKEKEDEGN